jgi:hypothetical protein
MKRFLVLFLLSACAPSVPVFTPVSVEVPISVPCKTAPVERPDFALARVARGEDLMNKMRAALIEINQRKAYEAALESQLVLCQ